jgi:hypothetical protein
MQQPTWLEELAGLVCAARVSDANGHNGGLWSCAAAGPMGPSRRHILRPCRPAFTQGDNANGLGHPCRLPR